MPIAYLIIAHSMPDHFGRLIRTLSDENTDFYVHVNQQVSIEPFLAFRSKNVCFLEPRTSIFWGEWQLAEVTLKLIKRALEAKRKYSYLILLSGSCYPIRRKEYVQGLFEENYGDQFINTIKMPNIEEGKPLSRLERFHIKSDQSAFEFYRRVVMELISRPKVGSGISKKMWLNRDWRRALGPLVPHGGSAWWALTSDACRYVMDFVRKEQSIVRFFENSEHPSEMFFQTILANSPFATQLRPSLTYADWSAGGGHPVEISDRHITMFSQQWPLIEEGLDGKGERCFARKFPDDGGRIAKLVDELVQRREGGYKEALNLPFHSPLLTTR
jgi:hypothetical protein